MIITKWDPNSKYPAIEHQALADACGIIPYWVLLGDKENLNFEETIRKFYQFGIYEMEGCTVSADGTMSYPGDPDLHPIVVWENEEHEKLFMYEASIMAILSEGNTFVTRVD